jgi:hypothetical protein
MNGWKPCGVVIEGQPIDVGGLNPWDFRWVSLKQPPVELPHPGYPAQRHKMWVYQIASVGKKVVFAAGELSANVWGFYAPVDPKAAPDRGAIKASRGSRALRRRGH